MLLKNGSRGAEVKQLQTHLGLTADGIFGNGTEAAVKKWQADNGLVADGIVGSKTWAKMEAASTDSTEKFFETWRATGDSWIAFFDDIEVRQSFLNLDPRLVRAEFWRNDVYDRIKQKNQRRHN